MINKTIIAEGEMAEFTDIVREPDALMDNPTATHSIDYTFSPNTDLQYVFIEASYYAQGVNNIRRTISVKGKKTNHPRYTITNGPEVFRPLTLRETIEARVNDFETLNDEYRKPRSHEDRTRLFGDIYIDTCTGIAHKGKSNKFKVQPICTDLIEIGKTHQKEFRDVDYDTFDGEECSLDHKMLHNLTRNQFLNHAGCRAIYENDVNLMKAYWAISHSIFKQDKLMSFQVRLSPEIDMLYAACVLNVLDITTNYNYSSLSDSANFIFIKSQK